MTAAGNCIDPAGTKRPRLQHRCSGESKVRCSWCCSSGPGWAGWCPCYDQQLIVLTLVCTPCLSSVQSYTRSSFLSTAAAELLAITRMLGLWLAVVVMPQSLYSACLCLVSSGQSTGTLQPQTGWKVQSEEGCCSAAAGRCSDAALQCRDAAMLRSEI